MVEKENSLFVYGICLFPMVGFHDDPQLIVSYSVVLGFHLRFEGLEFIFDFLRALSLNLIQCEHSLAVFSLSCGFDTDRKSVV